MWYFISTFLCFIFHHFWLGLFFLYPPSITRDTRSVSLSTKLLLLFRKRTSSSDEPEPLLEPRMRATSLSTDAIIEALALVPAQLLATKAMQTTA